MITDRELKGVAVAILVTLVGDEILSGGFLLARSAQCRCTQGTLDATILSALLIFGFFSALLGFFILGLPVHRFLQQNTLGSWPAYVIAGSVSGAALGAAVDFLLGSISAAASGFLWFVFFQVVIAASVALLIFWHITVRPEKRSA